MNGCALITLWPDGCACGVVRALETKCLRKVWYVAALCWLGLSCSVCCVVLVGVAYLFFFPRKKGIHGPHSAGVLERRDSASLLRVATSRFRTSQLLEACPHFASGKPYAVPARMASSGAAAARVVFLKRCYTRCNLFLRRKHLAESSEHC